MRPVSPATQRKLDRLAYIRQHPDLTAQDIATLYGIGPEQAGNYLKEIAGKPRAKPRTPPSPFKKERQPKPADTFLYDAY